MKAIIENLEEKKSPMESVKPKNTTEYIASFPNATQTKLKELRAIIRSTAPDAEESISYGIPAYKLNGAVLIYFAGYKQHVSVYPAPRGDENFKGQLSKFKGGKGTVQFPLTDPLPIALIKKILKFRLAEAKAKAVKKKN
jgi:uncharacterized protein YdhG (YjbR/CyaY superfamily)